MKEIEFDVGGAPVVFTNKQPPPYNPLNRPKISYRKFVFSLIGFFLVIILVSTVSHFFISDVVKSYIDIKKDLCTSLIVVTAAVIYILIILKKAIIWLIHFYQNHAPDRVRLKCVFEPSCSEYMLMCIDKFGVIRGVFKGCLRLLRCHSPNGGKDYP